MELLRCYLPFFNFIISFKYGDENVEEYQSFRTHCLYLLEQAVNASEKCLVRSCERDEAFFAVVVWTDEMILASSLAFRTQWRNAMLQRKFFQIADGGEAFFSHLDTLDEGAVQARQVYLYCLQNGFHGMYGVEKGNNSLVKLIEQERLRCLGENWCHWPNDAVLTPVKMDYRSSSDIRKKRYTLCFVTLTLSYTILTLVIYFKLI